MQESHCLTVTGAGILNKLLTECLLAPAFDPTNGDPPPPHSTFTALWDTGATNSVITQAVVDACGLKQTGVAIASSVQGDSEVEVYWVSIGLKNRVSFPQVRVTKGALGEFDVLIGMDIISSGDFSVTNKDAKTVFSFRVPSIHHVDYVQQLHELLAREKFKHGGQKSSKRPAKHFGKGK